MAHSRKSNLYIKLQAAPLKLFCPWSHNQCETSCTPLNGDFIPIVYYQNDKIHFKQILFSSCTEIVTQAASCTPASTWSSPFSAQK
jgi:hypothetical protein